MNGAPAKDEKALAANTCILVWTQLWLLAPASARNWANHRWSIGNHVSPWARQNEDHWSISGAYLFHVVPLFEREIMATRLWSNG